MYQKNTIGWLKHKDFILIDLILLQTAFMVAYVIRNGRQNPYENELYRNTAIIIILLDLCIGFFMESYKNILKRGYWKEFKAVFSHVLSITAGSMAYLFAMKESASYSRLVMFYFFILSIIIIYVARILWKNYLKNYKKAETSKRSIVIISMIENYAQLIDSFKDNTYGNFRVAGCAVLSGNMKNIRVKEYRGVPVYADENKFLEMLQSSWVDEVFIDIPKEEVYPTELIEKCNIMGITVHQKLFSRESDGIQQIVEKVGEYTVLSSGINMAAPRQLFLKRFMDICGGIVGLFCTFIIFIFIGPIIYIKSPGPILFKQWRVGKNGRKFKIYKFRSMYMDAEERKKELMVHNNIKDGLMFKMDNDPRIIKGIGHFIRNYSLDEFPQFWNVLKGDMSLVGTRPPTVEEWEKYELHHRTRLAIKPGLTGMWQVSGRSSITDFEEVVKLDMKYIREWDIGTDLRILMKTFRVIINKDGAM